MEKRLLIWGESREIRCRGTALFLSDNSKRYLVTARHVVWDKKSAEREFQEEMERGMSWPSATEKKLNRICSIIFRVPSYDEVISNYKEISEPLMNLGAGPADMHPYTFSTPDVDLAVISLNDELHSKFADELLEAGYEPISLEDIAEKPSEEGTDVFTVGFPGSVSEIGTLIKKPAEINWSSQICSLPAFAFGKVSMLNEKLCYFWADMSIYPGNSGGPVIENDKLVGIVSAQPTVESIGVIIQPRIRDSKIAVDVRIPFGKMIKAKYLLNLIRQQEQKDNFSPP